MLREEGRAARSDPHDWAFGAVRRLHERNGLSVIRLVTASKASTALSVGAARRSRQPPTGQAARACSRRSRARRTAAGQVTMSAATTPTNAPTELARMSRGSLTRSGRNCCTNSIAAGEHHPEDDREPPAAAAEQEQEEQARPARTSHVRPELQQSSR